MTRSRNFGNSITVAAVLALSACGSSSNNDNSAAPTQDDPTSGTPAVTDTPVVADTPDTPNTDPIMPTPGGDDSTLYLGANNTAVLQGPLIGTGAVTNESGVRDITVTFGALGNGLSLSSMRLFENPQDLLTDFVVVIENTSDQFACEINTVEGRFVNQDGIVSDRTRADIETSGSIGAIPSIDGIIPGYRNECVLPGTMIFGYGTVNPVDNVAEIRGDGVNAFEFENTPFEVVVEPVSYEVQQNGQIDVLVANRGNLRVNLQRIDLYLLDSDGSVVGLLRGFGGPTLEPGAEGVMSVPVNNFAGQVSTVRAVIDFSGPNRLP